MGFVNKLVVVITKFDDIINNVRNLNICLLHDAFMNGKMKIKGIMAKAMKLNYAFGE